MVALILYVSLYPFRFAADGPSVAGALQQLTWARASRGDMFNNVLLYVPLGFCLALVVEPRLGRIAGHRDGAHWAARCCRSPWRSRRPRSRSAVPSLTDLSLNAAGALAGAVAGLGLAPARRTHDAARQPERTLGAVALSVLVLWLIARLWPLLPDAEPAAAEARRAAAVQAGASAGRSSPHSSSAGWWWRRPCSTSCAASAAWTRSCS